MTNNLIKFIDTSVFPVALLICAKVFGMVIVNNWLGLEWSFISTDSSIYSIRIAYQNMDQAMQADSYSNLFMYLIMFIGFCLTLVQAYFFHDTHISPVVASKLIDNVFVHFISNSFEIFHRSSVWLILIWITTIMIILSTLSGNTYIWIAVISTLFTIMLSSLLAFDFERELKLSSS